ncbi:MAG: hypothetical protein HFG89_00225 [Dorea sp.]|jgi:hypothetical protein|nr:hypothetical protein [Dorea sp.]
MWFIVWTIITVFVASHFQKNMTKSQQDRINSTTYIDEVVVDGKKKKIRRDKCPTCGNRDIGYQMVNSRAATVKHGDGKVSTTNISSYKQAICSKCGTSFAVIRETTPGLNWFKSLIISFFLCKILELIVLLLMMFLGI